MLATNALRLGPLVVAAAVIAGAAACGGGERSPEADGPDQAAFTPPLSSRSLPFVSLEDAQGLTTFDIAVPEELPDDATLDGVRLFESFWEPKEVDMVELVITGPGYTLLLAESAGLQTRPARETVTIDGIEAQVRRYDKDGKTRVSVGWSRDDLGFAATAFLSDEFTEEVLLAVLESIP